MNNFNSQEYWQQRYVSGGNSGAGSYGVEAVTKANIINHWIKQYDIRTIFEAGSGDGNNLLFYHIPTSYCGYDVSPKAIELCLEKTRKIPNSLKYYFTSDIKMIDTEADLCLSLDVMYHLIEDSVFEDYCNLLFKNNYKYVIIYSTDTDSQFLADGTPLAPHVRFRSISDMIKKYPEYELLYMVSGFNTDDGKQMLFPSDKRFFLLKKLANN